MEPVSIIWIVVGGIVLLGLGWAAIKFFFRLAKHLIIALILAVILMVVWYQPWNWKNQAKDPNIGKLAYITGTDKFVGVIVGSDNSEGVWIVEMGNHRTKYSKSRLDLRSK